MMRYFCVSVEFLDPLFHGKGDNETPEWPPSPMRLFQALLAGSRTGCYGRSWSHSKTEAFRWLERLNPPVIAAPEARPVAGYAFYVPNNDSDQKLERQDRLASRAKVVRPCRLTGQEGQVDQGQSVHYLWPISDKEWPRARDHSELLCREARHLMALGWGIDQVVGNGRILSDAEVKCLSGRRWCASRSHRPEQALWRIPTKGSLEDLENVHKSFLARLDAAQFNPPLKLRRFERVTYSTSGVVPLRASARFELPEGVAFRQVDAVRVAAMLRSLTCDEVRYRNRQDFTELFPNDDPSVYLAGHVQETIGATPPRFSYLPLPTIGHEHADGMIRRLLIAEPYGGDGSRARWAERRLRNQILRDREGKDRVPLLDLWRKSSQSVVHRYVGKSRIWSTVTPAILPGFDDGKHSKAEKLFFRAIEQAGLPRDSVVELTLRKAPFWPGSQHPREYHRPQYLKNLPGWHAHLVFREPVPGPLAIGAGRHVGLGLMAAAE